MLRFGIVPIGITPCLNEGDLIVLLYGDGKQQTSLHQLLDRCQANVRGTNLDDLRSLLILTGQLEQAIEDCRSASNQRIASYSRRREEADSVERFTHPPPHVGGYNADEISRLAVLAREATDAAATAFCCGGGRSRAFGEARSDAESSVARCRLLLERMRSHGDRQITVKIPEGFAFYSLYPEQYCLATEKWAVAHASAKEKRALVVGIRSIGTTLSAVVAATLRSLGWQASRITVRPEGDPFNRRIEHLPEPSIELTPALIVDEGPGLSGSSMAAVAEWLNHFGFQGVAFLPGHGNEPGPNCSENVRRFWARIPRYFSNIEGLRWNGKTLKKILAETSTELGFGRVRHSVRAAASSSGIGSQGTARPVSQRLKFTDLSAGNWRNLVFRKRDVHPPVFKMLERSKLLFQGSESSLLWKFDGLMGLDSPDERLKQLADEEFVPELVDRQMGFVAMPWIEGERLHVDDARCADVLRHLTDYLCRAAGPALSDTQFEEGIERLASMLQCNSKEALGEDFAHEINAMKQAAWDYAGRSSYGDGHLAPHEWVRTDTGSIIKTDFFGHTTDHTLVGAQSVLWDVAGLIIEWNLDEEQIAFLKRSLRQPSIEVFPEALRFYRCAYAAFRTAMMSFAMANAGEDELERDRALEGLEKYKDELRRSFKQITAPGFSNGKLNRQNVSQVRARFADRE